MDSSISDLMKKFSNMMNDSDDTKNESSTGSKVSPEMLNSFLGGSSNIDFDTIMKIKCFMDEVGRRDTPDCNLLSSLKPYLKESRKNKVDTYISLLNMSKAMNLFRWW